jgi:uncharacterized protein
MSTERPLPSPAIVRSLIASGKDQEALACARRLADACHPDGYLMLGWMYQTGVGVGKNDEKAKDYYLLAANQGSALGMFYLGWFYATNSDLERAVDCFTLSSNNGCSAATYQLGRMYLAGYGVQKSQQTATECFETAAKRGHLYARMYIGREMLHGRRGIARIPVGLFKVLQVIVAFGRTDQESELLLRVGGHHFPRR